MVTIDNTDPIRTEDIQNGSFSVPSGEVWQGTLTHGENGTFDRMKLNNTPIGTVNNNSDVVRRTWSVNIVLVGGDTISVNEEATFRGREISSTIDNSTVSEQVSNGTISVPTGETWKVTIMHTADGGFDRATLNSSIVSVVDDTDTGRRFNHWTSLLEEGDTLDTNTPITVRGFIV